MSLEKELSRLARERFSQPLEALTPQQLHTVLSETVMGRIRPAWERSRSRAAAGRRAFYFSAEYLVGRAIFNNLLCTGLLEPASGALAAAGQTLSRLEEIEDAALGNGGLGRLAACFLDSAATLRLPLDGYGIRYRYGYFRQRIVNGFQQETAEDWTRFGDPWAVARPQEQVTVSFGDGDVLAVPYDTPVVGYGAGYVATLRLWECQAAEPFDFDAFNRHQYDRAVRRQNRAEDVSRVLYPSDSTPAGRLLRLRQQYFFCSASLQDMLRAYEKRHGEDWGRLPERITIQLNDTHPVIAIPEFIRLLLERGISFDWALDMSRRIFHYTNHTVMPEALEKWELSTLRRISPPVARIVRLLSVRQETELERLGVPQKQRSQMRFLQGETVHMAYLACWCCEVINGVAQLHTEILQNRVLAAFHQWHPNKIQNKTNGVTQRRWLLLCDPGLSDLLTEQLGGDGWITDLSRLKQLRPLAEDEEVMRRFVAVKEENKRRLRDYIRQRDGLTLEAEFLLDVQVKRLHEYKRQLLNILCILELYFRLREGALPDFAPTAFLFGGKAAPDYTRAKAIIKLINAVGALIRQDDRANRHMQVIFVPNYDVSYGEKIMAAADVSVQISTAGTEASGTGNMKLMMNGAVTMGTYDGANVEIVQEAGEENNYIFGARVEDIRAMEDGYSPRKLYEQNGSLRRCLNALVDGTLDDGGTGLFRELYAGLLDGAPWHRADPYYVLADFALCLETRLRINREYGQDRLGFAKKQWRNICAAGKFSSDRTVEEYARDIWHIS